MIEIKNVYKTYTSGPQAVEVLKGIDLVIRKAEVVTIVGPSGVGKSTLLHIMGALDVPTEGQVVIGGKEVQNLQNDSLAKFRNKAVGFVFQFHHLLPEFTAFENVIIPSMMHEPLNREKEEYARFLLNEVGLSHRLEHKPSELSGGEQQRVAVARALMNKPMVLLADEPTGNLDNHNSEMLYNLLLELNQKLSQTLVIVTHDQHMTDRAHRIIRLDDGRVAGEKRNVSN
ncbi:MAG TPA: ABC transporter ATP-binding protein [Caldithrix abyssi]|uniref:ABC transporter ATP-binding protein n=1 Tax=Caldithrix abyssi TaxID=187145 RepID=A0A7V4U066_CALAY|nr:ABC transporter ATP-binding protein [Caldithrix abyssi]